MVVPALEADKGSKVTFGDVLLTSGEDGKVSVGEPLVKGASVTAEVIDQDRTPKITVFKRKRRKGYRRKQGHRQKYTVVRVAEIKT